MTKLRNLLLADNQLEAVPFIPDSVRIVHLQVWSKVKTSKSYFQHFNSFFCGKNAKLFSSKLWANRTTDATRVSKFGKIQSHLFTEGWLSLYLGSLKAHAHTYNIIAHYSAITWCCRIVGYKFWTSPPKKPPNNSTLSIRTDGTNVSMSGGRVIFFYWFKVISKLFCNVIITVIVTLPCLLK